MQQTVGFKSDKGGCWYSPNLPADHHTWIRSTGRFKVEQFWKDQPENFNWKSDFGLYSSPDPTWISVIRTFMIFNGKVRWVRWKGVLMPNTRNQHSVTTRSRYWILLREYFFHWQSATLPLSHHLLQQLGGFPNVLILYKLISYHFIHPFHITTPLSKQSAIIVHKT